MTAVSSTSPLTTPKSPPTLPATSPPPPKSLPTLTTKSLPTPKPKPFPTLTAKSLLTPTMKPLPTPTMKPCPPAKPFPTLTTKPLPTPTTKPLQTLTTKPVPSRDQRECPMGRRPISSDEKTLDGECRANMAGVRVCFSAERLSQIPPWAIPARPPHTESRPEYSSVSTTTACLHAAPTGAERGHPAHAGSNSGWHRTSGHS